MGDLQKVVVEHFQDVGLAHQVFDHEAIGLGVTGRHAPFLCLALVHEKHRRFTFLSRCPVKVPEARRVAVAELLCRINEELMLGNFEMNFDTGEIRFRTAVDVDGDTLTTALVRNVVARNIVAADHWFPAVAAVVFAGAEPKLAIDRAKAADRPLN